MRPMSENDAYINFTFNRLVLNHEAQELGIKPKHEEVVAFVKTLRPFQGDGGQFDFKKYSDFAQTRLPALGFTERTSRNRSTHWPESRERSPRRRLPSPRRAREFYERGHGKQHVSVVRFPREDFQKAVNLLMRPASITSP